MNIHEDFCILINIKFMSSFIWEIGIWRLKMSIWKTKVLHIKPFYSHATTNLIIYKNIEYISTRNHFWRKKIKLLNFYKFKYSTNQYENLNLPLHLFELTLLYIENFPILQHLALLSDPHQLSKNWSHQCMHSQWDHRFFLVIEPKKEKHMIIHNCE